MCVCVCERRARGLEGTPVRETGSNYEARGGARLCGTVRDSEKGEREMNSGRRGACPGER
jgi:hypothetical protein